MKTIQRVVSGIQPTGAVHLGNYIGAMRQWTKDQFTCDSIYCVVDLHAITVPANPRALRENTLAMAQTLLAIGLDPQVCTLIIQSHLADFHNELATLLQSVIGMGDLRRMTQFKDKKDGAEDASVGLFTYPILMAADILAYGATRVPVGEDQRQHVELARDIARRMNACFGEIFPIPSAVTPRQGARIRDLQNPEKKMSKSSSISDGIVFLFEDASSVQRKILQAVSGVSESEQESSPGVQNMLALFAAATDSTTEDARRNYSTFDSLKVDTANAVCEMLRPIQERKREFDEDPTEVRRIFADGAEKARDIARVTRDRVRNAMGLLPSIN